MCARQNYCELSSLMLVRVGVISQYCIYWASFVVITHCVSSECPGGRGARDVLLWWTFFFFSYGAIQRKQFQYIKFIASSKLLFGKQPAAGRTRRLMEVFILNARRALCEGKDAWSAVAAAADAAGEETANKGLQAVKVPYLMLLAVAALCLCGVHAHVGKGCGGEPKSLPEIYLANWHT